MPGLDEDGRRKATKRGKSASGEFDEPEGHPAPAFVEVSDDAVEEFEPVDEDAPAVVWEDEEDRHIMESRWEDLLEDLFGDADEFRAFELMSALEKKRFLRNKLREHQASGAADAGDLELDAAMRRRSRARRERGGPPPARPPGPGTEGSLMTEAERAPEDLDTGLGGDRHRHHHRRDRA